MGGHDQNFVATIVLPLDDEKVRDKLRNKADSMLFVKDKRVSLWRWHTDIPKWAIVYDKGSKDFRGFLSRLQFNTSQAGYPLEQVFLQGSDNAPISWEWKGGFGGLKKLIIVERAQGRLSSERRVRLLGFTDWKKIELSSRATLDKAKEYVRLEEREDCLSEERKKPKGTTREKQNPGATDKERYPSTMGSNTGPTCEYAVSAALVHSDSEYLLGKLPHQGGHQKLTIEQDATRDTKQDFKEAVKTGLDTTGLSTQVSKLNLEQDKGHDKMEASNAKIRKRFGEILDDLKGSWQCHKEGYPEVTARFLTVSGNPEAEYISTKLQKLIKTAKESDAALILEPMALSHMHLARWAAALSS
jgi:hypothetical protein